jgi:hypothetical protein
VLLALVVSGVVWVLLTADRETPPARPAPTLHETSALRVLHSWDRRRAAAYATGSTTALRDLYVPGSGAGVADLRMLGSYRARALRVTGMRMQVLALSVLEARPGWRRVRVTDRLVGAVTVHGQQRVRLPHDQASTRVVTLMRGADRRWRVTSVTDG